MRYIKRMCSSLKKKIGVRKYVRPKCGHKQLKKELVEFWKGKKVKLEFLESHLYCAECLKKYLAGCANCGDVIFPGNSVALAPLKKAELPPAYIRMSGKLFFCCKKCSKRSSISVSGVIGIWTGKKVLLLGDRR